MLRLMTDTDGLKITKTYIKNSSYGKVNSWIGKCIDISHRTCASSPIYPIAAYNKYPFYVSFS